MTLRSIALTVGVAVLSGCATGPGSRAQKQWGESVVLAGEQPAHLTHRPLRGKPVSVRNTYEAPGSISYNQGQDFVINYEDATITRTPGSRIPDFQTNILFGKENFDHTQFPGYGNGKFFAFVDYSYRETEPWPVQSPQLDLLPATFRKLQNGETLKIVAFGDSITAGGEATRPDLIFWQRWANELQHSYPKARVMAVNGATGGDTTRQGLQRLQTKVLDEKPDLVLIGFGMNDNNRGSVPLDEFQQNLHEMISKIRRGTSAEVILFSAFPPNPKWKFGSEHMADYAAATQQVARESLCAYADVFDNWTALAARKKPEDLLGNNINHPNDFGHWIYFSVFEKLGFRHR